MSFQQFLLILKARRWAVLSILLLTVATTVAVSLILPKQYSASTEVVIDVRSPDPIAGIVLPGLITPGYMATQVDIVQSDRVAGRVVKLLRLDQNPGVQQEWRDATEGRGTIQSWLIELLKKKLEVKPSRESNVISIGFTGTDPRFAAAVANAFAQAYLETTLELKVEPARQYAAWFGERSTTLRGGLEKAQARLSQYQREHGIVAADERLDVENARLAELSSQLVVVQAQATETASRQRQAKGGTENLPEVLQNPLVQGMKADVARQEAKLNELAGQLGKNHPQYQRTADELQTLHKKLDAEMKQVASGIGTSNRINQQREGELRSALAAQKAKVMSIKNQRDELAVLQREVENAQRAYDAVAQRLTQTSLESQTQQTNVVVLTPAVEPIEPSSPKLLLNSLLAVFLGTLLGVGCALLLETLSRRVRSAEDLAQALGLPVLGVLEPTRAARRWFGRATRAA
ncbi:MAG TPA: chain length determinant protein EpsF [Rhodocyclaceae bacterium]|nr:MAG: chain length determinant protein EpsF [Betaproteobacteria bacterium CG2_30_68_42]PIV75609.1 MAG: chain length determinant protein EpsF [Rhodocyclales bacterium CG17_big_fil_post_rev_8_21_14_2_50_68_7]PJA58755.1 MAG: chain length determinant protein EpsF [Rhodocyclales bacterium CG_4_9_14_3_um_filter_68_10]HCX33926.1 chain length determinant protein EpsF [Rhodocyclaceae bacterium]